MKLSLKNISPKTLLYWGVEIIGMLILVLSLVAKIKPFLPAKDEKKDEKEKKDNSTKEKSKE